jgi:hypothetical protein
MNSSPPLFSADHWLAQARRLRGEAATMKTPAAKAELLLVVEAYERLARYAAEHETLAQADLEAPTIEPDR